MTLFDWLILAGFVCFAILGAGLLVYSITRLVKLDEVDDFDQRG